MPCYDKKLEASRPDFADADGVRDVDCVLTTGEVQKMLDERSLDLRQLARDAAYDDSDVVFPSLLGHPGSSSGSYVASVIESVARAQPSLDSIRLETRAVRGADYTEHRLIDDATSPPTLLFKGATCNGFRNLQNVVRKIGREAGIAVTRGANGVKSVPGRAIGAAGRRSRRGTPTATPESEAADPFDQRGYDWIEVMACPSGCVNGGGQIPASRASRDHALDSEGMPLVDAGAEVKIVADLDPIVQPGVPTVVPAKDWVARVESLYWTIGEATTESARPWPPRSRTLELADEVARSIEADLLAGFDGDERERRRHQHFRTQYRAVEGEVNGLAVVW